MLSVSTCWNSGRHTEGAEMLQELLDLGFTRVELGHGIRLSLMEGVQRMVEAGKVTISSLHNFCPLPVEITRASPDCYQFSSPDERERERAVKFSFQTIDFATRLGAKFVVLHLGRTPIDDYTEKLVRMAEVGLGQSRKYIDTKLTCIKQREAKAAPFLRRSIECLRRVANYAAEKDIKLGVESRHCYEEIPNETEMIEVLNEFKDSQFSALVAPCGSGKSTAQVALAIQDVVASGRLQVFVVPQTVIADGFFKGDGDEDQLPGPLAGG